MSEKANPEAELAYGAGHIDPLRATRPGLVYDADEIDYVNFLCGLGYSTKNLRSVTGDQSACSASNSWLVLDLNYPSFAVPTSTLGIVDRTFTRSVTNVGSPSSVYKSAVVNAPAGLEIQVKPSVLSYKSLGEKLSYVVTIQGRISNSIESASLIWSDGVHEVRSPIVLFKVRGYVPPPGPRPGLGGSSPSGHGSSRLNCSITGLSIFLFFIFNKL